MQSKSAYSLVCAIEGSILYAFLLYSVLTSCVSENRWMSFSAVYFMCAMPG